MLTKPTRPPHRVSPHRVSQQRSRRRPLICSLLITSAALVGSWHLSAVGQVPPPAAEATGEATVEQRFSGPQPGERLPEFPIRLVLDPTGQPAGSRVGQDVDASELAGDRPLLLIVMHQLTRPNLLLARTALDYVADHQPQLGAGLVLLGPDPVALSQQLERASGAMPQGVPVGYSRDGLEGPGSYGFHREVQLTVLLASEGEVRHNLAIVDANLPTQLPKILQPAARLVGGDPPPIERLIQRATGDRDGRGARR